MITRVYQPEFLHQKTGLNSWKSKAKQVKKFHEIYPNLIWLIAWFRPEIKLGWGLPIKMPNEGGQVGPRFQTFIPRYSTLQDPKTNFLHHERKRRQLKS